MNTFKKVLTLALFLCLSYQEGKSQELLHLLAREWQYVKSEILAIPYYPNKAETKDRLVLSPDATYQWVVSGMAEIGTWALTEGGRIVSLKSSKGESKVLHIESITPNNLVFRVREPWKFDKLLHMHVPADSI